MDEYIYPTEPGWIERMVERWLESEKTYFAFSFLNFLPTTINSGFPFYMYLYYTKKQTEDVNLSGKIQYRVRVVSVKKSEFEDEDTFTFRFNSGISKIWFKCDLCDNLETTSGFLTLDDFAHAEDQTRVLSSAIRTSIAPVKLTSRAITRESRYSRSNGTATKPFRYWVMGDRSVNPQHFVLQENYVTYLRENGFTPIQNRNFVDVQYVSEGTTIFVEIKPTDNVASKYAIRAALGQLLEYRFHLNRDAKLEVVLGSKPTAEEIQFVMSLGISITYFVEAENTFRLCSQ